VNYGGNSTKRKMPGGPVPRGAIGAGSNGGQGYEPPRVDAPAHSTGKKQAFAESEAKGYRVAQPPQPSQGGQISKREYAKRADLDTLAKIVALKAEEAERAARRDAELAAVEAKRAAYHKQQATAKAQLAAELRTTTITEGDRPAVVDLAAVDLETTDLAVDEDDTDDEPRGLPWGWILGGAAAAVGGLWWLTTRR
jgi:hypothetical protein